ncbi:hypothetical protein HDV02_001818 [Globomyces sp. JEL0801]|nr:hypothetical protein HDV02_001818 [Globomyces sp. JEL0801]
MSIIAKPKKNKKKSTLAMLADLDDQDQNNNDNDSVEEITPVQSTKKKGKKGKKNRNDEEEDSAAILAALDAAEENDQEIKTPIVPQKKAKKGKKNRQFDDEEDAAAILAALDAKEAEMENQEPVPEVDTSSKKKGKGGKKSRKNDDVEDAAEILAALDAEESQMAEKTVQPEKAKPEVKEKEKAQDEEPTRIKSKKEKEKERKERAKLAQKSKTKKETFSLAEVAAAETVAVEEDQKNQKGKKGKKGGQIAALREALEAKRAAEEEAARQEELIRKKQEEEEARAAEEERLKAEAKQKKREREKARKEELKKSGKYMTPAQKLAAQQAKAKLDAMIAAGLVVPALMEPQDKEEGAKKKKVVYSNRRKGFKSKFAQPESTKSESIKSDSVKSESVKGDEPKESWDAADNEDTKEEAKDSWDQESDKDVKDSWDAESDKDVKDSWDAESDEGVKDSWDAESEEEPAPEPKEEKKKETTKATTVEKNKPDSIQKDKTKVKVEEKAPSKKDTNIKTVEIKEDVADEDENDESEEEEEEDDEEDSGSDEDDSEEDDSDEDEDDESDEEDSDDEMTATERQALIRKEEAHKRRQERIAQSYAARSKDNLRSPICCILGHVDTGKTKILDKIRQTNVQEGEAGGITQQIGATYFPIDAIEEKTKLIHKDKESGYQLPGLLVIDTPGHESFTNLRTRGSSLCNIAVLVVDIVHGLEPQTLESLNMLRARKTPFVVALNKIDRMFDWETHKDMPTRDTLALQKKHVVKEFEDRVTKTIVEFAEQGLNACLYWENTNMGKNVSLIPTSAVTGEGIPDLLHLLMDLCQSRMAERLMYISELECTVLEVKVIEGLGTTIDVVLSNGVLNEGDRICVCGLNGPIVTTVRALLTPQPMRELRVKSAYQHHKTVKASLGIKISAPDLEKAIAGSRLLVIGPDDDEDDIREEVMEDLQTLLTSIDKSGKGVCVQASTLGSLEALLSFLRDCKIPVSGINIGPVHKKDIIRASIMLEKCPEYAQLLAFDVPIDREIEQLAADMGVKIFSANIIYHLFDQYTAYMKDLEESKKRDAAPSAVFPCLIKMIPDAVFNKRSPIIIGVDVVEGTLKLGTPLCVVGENGNVISLGKVVGIELNKKPKQEVKRGDPSVSIRLECPNYATPAAYGRHFTDKNDIYAHVNFSQIINVFLDYSSQY